MSFISLHFAIFLPVFVVVYFLWPAGSRWVFALLASCYFYMAFIPVYILILAILILSDYVLAIQIETAAAARRKYYLALSAAANLGMLGIFKYANFFSWNAFRVMHYWGGSGRVHVLSWALPLGLSFHTFQSLGYIIDVYRGQQKAERHLGYYALYVMFFFQLVAGPIERARHLLPQLHRGAAFSSENMVVGLRTLLWGVLQKVVLADTAAVFVNRVYDQPTLFNGWCFVLATVLFAFQIYGDFCGYSNIALGSAKLLGIDIIDNFNRPYGARSVAEFWQRWHISLSTWFRDYLYIPLGGSRVPWWRWMGVITVVFGLSGLWHGARMTFVVWGLLNGFYLIVYRAYTTLRPVRTGWEEQLGRPVTFLCISLAWVFFRAPSVHAAISMLSQMTLGLGRTSLSVEGSDFLWSHIYELIICASAVLGLLVVEGLCPREGWNQWLSRQHVLWRWGAYYTALFLIICFGHSWDKAPFIYFQF